MIHMMQGRYNSVAFVGKMPDGTTRWFCTDGEYIEAYKEELKEMQMKKTAFMQDLEQEESVVA